MQINIQTQQLIPQPMPQRTKYGKLLYFLERTYLIEKLVMLPFLRERSVLNNPDFANTNKYLCLKEKSLLIADRSVLKKIYFIDGLFEGGRLVIDRLWTLLILTVLGFDISRYYMDPIYQLITPAYTIWLGISPYSKSLSIILSNPYALLTVLSLPVAVGLMKGTLQSLLIPEVNTQAPEIKNYQSHFLNDILIHLPSILTFGLFPDIKVRRQLNIFKKQLLWDGNITPGQQMELFDSIKNLADTAHGFTFLQTIEVLAELVDGVDVQTYSNLINNHSVGMQTLSNLNRIKTESFNILCRIARGQPIGNRSLHNAWVSRLYAHYQLWQLGRLEQPLLHPVFGLMKIISLFLSLSLFGRIGMSIYQLIDAFVQEKECLNAGKQWLYIDQIADYMCSVCGDWQIYYKAIFTDESCWDAYVSQPRTVEQLAQAIERINFASIDTLDFTQQNLTGGELNYILPLLKHKAPNLQIVYFNHTMPIDVPPTVGAQAIADFIRHSQITQITLNLGLNSDDMAIISQALPESNIQILDFDSNQIGDEGFIALAAALPHSPIQVIYLYANKITQAAMPYLASALPRSNVTALNLNANALLDAGVVALVEGLPHSPVQLLNLIATRVGDEGIIALANVLNKTNISSLLLDYNFVTDTGAIALAKGLAGSNVQALHIGHTHIGNSGVVALAQAFRTAPMQSVVLTSDNIGDVGAIAIAEALINSEITYLKINSGNIGPNGTIALAHALASSKAPVQLLDLDENAPGIEGITELAHALPYAQVQRLYLKSCQLGDEGVAILAQALPSTPTLQTLQLGSNSLTYIGYEKLAEALPYAKIVSLYLSDNSPGKGINNLAAAFAHSPTIQNVNLRNNAFDSDAIAILSHALPSTNFQMLWLDNTDAKDNMNKIDDRAISFIAQALPETQIQELRLVENNITNNGAIALAEVLTTVRLTPNALISSLGFDIKKAIAQADPNTQLNILDLRNNQIGDEGIDALCKVLPQTNVSIQNFEVSGNPIQNLNLEGCINEATSAATSAAYTNTPHWIFTVPHSAYQTTIHYADSAYQYVKNLGHTDNEVNPFEVMEYEGEHVTGIQQPSFTYEFIPSNASLYSPVLPANHFSYMEPSANNIQIAPMLSAGIALYVAYKAVSPAVSKAMNVAKDIFSSSLSFFSSKRLSGTQVGEQCQAANSI